MIDRAGLATFLTRRRAQLQPEDVGLPRGERRRTAGLRREEVAVICHISTDYYSRLERQKGPVPSREMIASIAQGFHLSLEERDHLFRLAGHQPPSRGAESEHVSPGLMRILERLDDTPAEIVTEIGETLRQTRLGVALMGEASTRVGLARSLGYRWFTDPRTRSLYAKEDHEFLGRLFAAGLREIATARGPSSRAAAAVDALLAQSEEFEALWARHEVGVRPQDVKRYEHPVVGRMELNCQTLLDPDQSHRLMVYTATPGTESYERLQLLAVLGPQSLESDGRVAGADA